jgi:glycosyltransferase involved in cell wall biosynthesis
MRYIWDQYHRYFQNLGFLKRYYIRKQAVQLRIWDGLSSMRVDYFIANSNFVKDRVCRYYRRKAAVIHPPVDTEFFTPGTGRANKGEYYLAVSALVPYKRIDQLVRVFNRRSDKLFVVGKGSEEKRLKRMADSNIQFYRDLSNGELRDLYREARALIFSGVEDFGISFVEAQACGVPVIAYRKGGVCDIIPSDCGLLYEQQDDRSLQEALERFQQMTFHSGAIRENSLRFSRQTFREKFSRYVEDNSHD